MIFVVAKNLQILWSYLFVEKGPIRSIMKSDKATHQKESKMIAQKLIEKTSTPDIAHPLPHSNAKLEVTNNLIKLY